MLAANWKVNRLASKALAVGAGESVLELGCGPGSALRCISRTFKPALLIGVDSSPIMISQAALLNRRAIALGSVHLVECEILRLPFDDAVIDCILAVNIAYFFDGPAYIAEARRVLKTEGRIVLYVTHRSVMHKWPFARKHSHRLFGSAELASLLAEGGFEPQSIFVETVDAGLGITGVIIRAVNTLPSITN
jgi:ubiquinone/menaquinone biosynthesis C-methylase UbiE